MTFSIMPSASRPSRASPDRFSSGRTAIDGLATGGDTGQNTQAKTARITKASVATAARGCRPSAGSRRAALPSSRTR